MTIFETSKRVLYGETDRMGYMYYGQYPLLYELGRVEMLRDLGIPYKSLEDDYKIMMPVAQVESRYLAPAVYDELLTIKTHIVGKPGRIIVVHSAIENEVKSLIHQATVKLFFIDMVSKRNISCPQPIINILQMHI